MAELSESDELLPAHSVAVALGIYNVKMDRWIKRGLIPSQPTVNKQNNTVRGVLRSDLVAFARTHPQLLKGIEEGRLAALLQDNELAATITKRFPKADAYKAMPHKAVVRAVTEDRSLSHCASCRLVGLAMRCPFDFPEAFTPEAFDCIHHGASS